jgi:hypothetical protein
VPMSTVTINVVLILTGVVLAVVGTISSAMSLVQSIQRGHAA